MKDRFGGPHGVEYEIEEERLIRAETLPPVAKRKLIANEKVQGHSVIRRYVEDVAAIAHYDNDDDTIDLHTPLGDALPKEITPDDARDHAEELRAALQRAQELLNLLERRAGTTPTTVIAAQPEADSNGVPPALQVTLNISAEYIARLCKSEDAEAVVDGYYEEVERVLGVVSV